MIRQAHIVNVHDSGVCNKTAHLNSLCDRALNAAQWKEIIFSAQKFKANTNFQHSEPTLKKKVLICQF